MRTPSSSSRASTVKLSDSLPGILKRDSPARLSGLLFRQASKRIVHFPREALDLSVELLELGDRIVLCIRRWLRLGLEQGGAERGRRDRERELAAVIFAAIPHHARLDRADMRQLDLKGRADQHRN